MIASIVIRSFGLIMSYIMTIVLTRVMGSQEYGQFATALALASILAVLAELGLPVLLVREIATAKDALHRRRSVTAAYLAVLATSSAIALIVVLCLFALGKGSWPEAVGALVMFVPLALVHLRQSVTLSFLGAAKAFLPEQLLLPTAVTLVILFASWLVQPDMDFVVLVYAGVSLLVFWIAIRFLHTPVPADTATVTVTDVDWQLASSLAKRGVPFLFAQIPRVLASQIDLLIVGLLMGPQSAGLYAVASRVANLVGMPLFVVNMSYMPIFASNSPAGAKAGSDARASAFFSFGGGLLILLPLLVFNGPVLELFGPDYRVAAPVVAIMCIGQLLNVAAGPNGTILLMTGNENSAVKAVWFQTVALTVVTLACSWTGSLTVVAVGYVGCMIATNLLTSWLVWRHTGILVYPRMPAGGFKTIWHTIRHGPV